MKKIIIFLSVVIITVVGGYFAKGLIMNKPVLLIIADKEFQPIEYGHTRQQLEIAGFKVMVGSNGKKGTVATPSAGTLKPIIDVTLSEVNPDGYAGIFIIGGPGALNALDNQTTVRLMQNFASTGKPFGAICISPRILAKAGLLTGKKATGWDTDKELAGIFEANGVTYEQKPVVVDGSIVTADGPKAATAFGKAIVMVLQKK